MELTARGKTVYRRAYEKGLTMGRGILRTLDTKKQDDLIDLFRKVTKKIRNQEGLKRV